MARERNATCNVDVFYVKAPWGRCPHGKMVVTPLMNQFNLAVPHGAATRLPPREPLGALVEWVPIFVYAAASRIYRCRAVSGAATGVYGNGPDRPKRIGPSRLHS